MERISDIKTIVEIGPQANPVFHKFRDKKPGNLSEGFRYVAVDCKFENIKKFGDYYGLKGYSVQGDMRHLPLSDDFADQIWLMNVFGDFRNNPRLLPDGSLQYSMGIGDVFQELARVIKKDGVVYIGEIYPPIKKVSWLPDADYSGFGLEKEVYAGHREIMHYLERMGAIRGSFDSFKDAKRYPQFFLELRKK